MKSVNDSFIVLKTFCDTYPSALHACTPVMEVSAKHSAKIEVGSFIFAVGQRRKEGNCVLSEWGDVQREIGQDLR